MPSVPVPDYWSRGASFAFPILLILQLAWPLLYTHTPFASFYQPDPAFGYNPTEADTRTCQVLDSYVQRTNGAILAEDVGILINNGREPIGSAWLINVLHSEGLLDSGYAALKQAIVQKSFGLALLHWQSYPADLLNTVAVNYHQIDAIPCIFQWKVYVPNTP